MRRRTAPGRAFFIRRGYGAGGLTLSLEDPPEELRDAPPVVTQAPLDVRPGGPISGDDWDSQPSHLTLDQNDRMPYHEGAAGADPGGDAFPSLTGFGAGRTAASSANGDAFAEKYKTLLAAQSDPNSIRRHWMVTGLIRDGKAWADEIIRTRAIPPKQHKALEMAARAFAITRVPKDDRAWFQKNQKRFELLVEARGWSLRAAGGDGAEASGGETGEGGDVFPIAGFEVHNTVGASGKVLQGAQDVIQTAVAALPRAGVPGLAETAYGPLYLVGQIERPNWAAWYKPQSDLVFLRPQVRGLPVEESARHLVHELAHRLWAKSLDPVVKARWKTRHTQLKYKGGEYKQPPPGTPIQGLTVNRKPAQVGSYEPTGVNLVDAKTGAPIGKVGYDKFIAWMHELDRKARFPSFYAETDPEEHFCEAVSLAAFGKLAPEHLEALHAALGTEKTAAEDEELPLNPDGTVTLYHGTTPEAAERIIQEGVLRGDAERRVYLTTASSGTGYGTVVVAVDVDPGVLVLDDEFPDGRKDYAIEGRAVRVKNPRLSRTAAASRPEYPLAGPTVSGLTVGSDVSNTSSIGASLTDYTVLRGIRDVPMADFGPSTKSPYVTVSDHNHVDRVAAAIQRSKRIDPLIVVVDREGPYILEGMHRFDALRRILGARSFPALVVIDDESFAEQAPDDDGQEHEAEVGSDLWMLDKGEGGTALNEWDDAYSSPAGENFSEGGGSTIHLGQAGDVGAAVAERVGGPVPLERGVHPVGGNVLKITDEAAEANAMHVVFGNPSSLIVRVYDVFGFQVDGQTRYGILQEKLDPPSQAYAMLCDGFAGQPITRDHVEATIQAWEAGDLPHSVDVRQLPPDWKAWILGVASYFDQVGIHFEDLHGQNVMRKGSKHKVIDLGFSRTAQQPIEIIARKAMPMKKTRPGLILEVGGVAPRVQFNLSDYRYRNKEFPDEPKSLGLVSIGETPDPNVMMVRRADAYVSGYGPLMYDAALEWVAREGKWLCADRRSVSTDAAAVWTKYMSRPDVEKAPLPDALRTGGSRHHNPDQLEALNYMYRKPDDKVLRFFEKAYERQFGEKPYHIREREEQERRQLQPQPPADDDDDFIVPSNEEMREMTAQNQGRAPWLAVDLDGTLLQYESGMASRGQFGPPMKGAAQAMRELKSLGWKVSVFTARLGDGDPRETQAVADQIADTLEGYGIPFDDVWIGRKPKADYFVDDKAIPFRGSWDDVLQELVQTGQSGKGDGQEDWHVDDAAGQAAAVSMGHDGTTGLIDGTDDGGGNDFNDQGYTRHDISVARPPDRERMWF